MHSLRCRHGVITSWVLGANLALQEKKSERRKVVLGLQIDADISLTGH